MDSNTGKSDKDSAREQNNPVNVPPPPPPYPPQQPYYHQQPYHAPQQQPYYAQRPPYQAPPYYTQQPYQAPPYYANNNARRPKASGFAIASLVLGIVAIVFMAVKYIAITCAIAAIVFSVLSRKKGKFGQATAGLVLGIISLSLSVIVLVSSLIPKTGSSDTSSSRAAVVVPSSSETTASTPDDVIPLAEVLGTYEIFRSDISDAAVEYVATQAAASNIVITENSFEFDEFLGCAYYIYFDCTVDGVACHGHTSAFIPFEWIPGEDIIWIDFEVVTDEDGTVLVEWFDSEAEQISIEYYNMLVTNNGLPFSALPPSSVPESSAPESTPSSLPAVSSSEAAPVIVPIALGETITADGLELTIRYVDFVNHAPMHIQDNNYFATSPVADEGNILVDMCVDIKNTSTAHVDTYEFLDGTVIYNTDYQYGMREYFEDRFGLDSTGWLNSVDIVPLQVVEVRYIAQVPLEAYNNTGTPMMISILIDEVEYQLIVR